MLRRSTSFGMSTLMMTKSGYLEPNGEIPVKMALEYCRENFRTMGLRAYQLGWYTFMRRLTVPEK